nr:hypothetical protein [Subtercola vilae]
MIEVYQARGPLLKVLAYDSVIGPLEYRPHAQIVSMPRSESNPIDDRMPVSVGQCVEVGGDVLGELAGVSALECGGVEVREAKRQSEFYEMGSEGGNAGGGTDIDVSARKGGLSDHTSVDPFPWDRTCSGNRVLGCILRILNDAFEEIHATGLDVGSGVGENFNEAGVKGVGDVDGAKHAADVIPALMTGVSVIDPCPGVWRAADAPH